MLVPLTLLHFTSESEAEATGESEAHHRFMPWCAAEITRQYSVDRFSFVWRRYKAASLLLTRVTPLLRRWAIVWLPLLVTATAMAFRLSLGCIPA